MQNQTLSPPSSSLEMVNVAHRGLWKEAGLPQNTVESIKAAYAAGAQVVETDFSLTEAGEMICLHDVGALATMTDDVVHPLKITPADRARINLGEKLKLPRPYRIPLLEDVLAVVPKTGILQSEIKYYGKDYARRFDTAVKAAGLTEANIIVSSFGYEALADFHVQFPTYKTLWLGCDLETVADLDRQIARAKEAGFDIFCPGCDQAKEAGVTLADADRVRAAGLEFRVFGVNNLDALKYAASIRATGFTCNFHLTAYTWAREVPGVTLLPIRKG